MPANATFPELLEHAQQIRKDCVEMLFAAGSGHMAGSLGMADVFTALYFSILNHDPWNPKWEERDRLILSNGHICPVLYATLSRAGYFPREELFTLRKLHSRLQGHPSRIDLPGVETSSGHLGQGLSLAIGMALAARLDGAKHRIYCMMSDGEHDEGQTWEAILFANKCALENLIAIVDRNNIQIDGFTESVMPLESLRAKYEAFGWRVLEMDGNDLRAIMETCAHAQVPCGKPTVILAHTVPGKGVKEMEWKPEWHGKAPNYEEAREAMEQLIALHEAHQKGTR